MYVSNRIVSNATGDSLAHLADKAAGKAVEEAPEAGPSALLAGGSYDPSAQVSLSVEALLVLAAVRGEPAATAEAERTSLPADELERREYDAFGHFLDRGDRKSYHRAYIDFFDSLPLEDQRGERYAGTRENAVAALRAIAYNERVIDMTAGNELVEEAPPPNVRRATPIAAIFQPSQQDFDNAARVSGRISRATSMYSLGF